MIIARNSKMIASDTMDWLRSINSSNKLLSIIFVASYIEWVYTLQLMLQVRIVIMCKKNIIYRTN